MICVQNGPLNCKNSSPECTKNRYCETTNGTIFSAGGGISPFPHPPSVKMGTPPPHILADCRAYDAPTSAPSAPRLAPAALDHWVPPRFCKSGYGPGALLSKSSYVAGRCRYVPLTARVVWIDEPSVSRRLDGSRTLC